MSTSEPVIRNRKAFHDYHIVEKYEAGLALCGSEVKSLRAGRAKLDGGFGKLRGNQIFLQNVHISEYPQATIANHDPLRSRKLLLRRREIGRIAGKLEQKGLTLVPLSIYFKRGFAKVEMGIARGKQLFDKRKDIMKKETRRDIDRALSARARGKKT